VSAESVDRATIVRGAWALPMAAGSEPIRDGAVLIGGDGAIAAVGDFAGLREREPNATIAGDDNGIVMPGMVNAHTHLTECLIPGMAEDAVLFEWFERVVNPVGKLIDRDEVALGTRLKAVEMLRSGITTVNDMSCHRNLGSLATLGAVDGLAWAGLRGVVSFGAEDMYEGAPGPEAFLAEHEALADRAASESLISFRCGVGTVLGLSDPLFARTVAACREHGWGVHTHLSEVREELTEARLRWGGTTIEHSGREGLLDAEVIAAHCIWCTERDIGLLGRHDVAVAHNPVANMLLGNGICPVPRLRSEGITVALGTDGAASNDNQDMFGVIKTAGLLHKVNTMDPTVITARDVLGMATIEGARALGIDAEVGSLEPGKRADVVLLDGNTPELATIHDPWQQVVYCATARCVSDVWVDGVRRVESGAVPGVELPALAAEARAAGADLARRAGLAAESAYAGDGRAFAAAGFR
jgi:cytosine/adenosine deaminase-related metal-dependent hydrolase